MPSRQLLSTYRPGASLYCARAPIGSAQVIGGNGIGWFSIDVSQDLLVVGSDISRLNTATLNLDVPGTYYVQCRSAFENSTATGRRILAVEYINDFSTVGGSGVTIARMEGGASGNQWIAECSGMVTKPDSTYYGVRVLLYQETTGNLNTNNANQPLQTELNIRRVA